MPEVTAATPTTNGVAHPAFREQLADQMRGEIARLEERRDELAAQIAEVGSEIKAYQRSLAPLTGEPAPTRTYAPRKAADSATRTKPSQVSPERLADVKAAIRDLLGDDDREFRQVDLRERTGLNSGVLALAFRQLREDENYIRLARQAGPNKYFRLTRPALRDGQS